MSGMLKDAIATACLVIFIGAAFALAQIAALVVHGAAQ